MNDNPRDINVSISVGTVLKTVLLLLAIFLLFLIKDVVLVVLTAIVVASSIEPATKWIIRRGIPRVFSVVILYGIMGAMLAGMFYVFIPVLLQDTSDFLTSVPQYLDKVSLWNPIDSTGVEHSKQVASEISQGIAESRTVVADLKSSVNPSIGSAVGEINNALSNVSAGFIQTVSSIFGGIFGFILIVILSFYLSVQEDGIEKFLRIVIPLKHEKYAINLWKRSQEKIGLWMQGQLILAVLVGVLVYLGLTILGVRNALLFAFLAGLLETIPLFGPIIAAIPAVATAYTDSGISAGLFVAGLYLIIQQFENHLIYPLVVTKIVGVPPILVILALIVGGKLAGFLGLLLSVPMAATLVEFMDDIQKSKTAH
jgi:predicted PurR-regulated permease PerM